MGEGENEGVGGWEDGGSVREHAHGTSYLDARNQHVCNVFRDGRESRCAQSYCTRLSRISYILLHESCVEGGKIRARETAGDASSRRIVRMPRDARLLTISFRVGMKEGEKTTETGARRRIDAHIRFIRKIVWITREWRDRRQKRNSMR